LLCPVCIAVQRHTHEKHNREMQARHSSQKSTQHAQVDNTHTAHTQHSTYSTIQNTIYLGLEPGLEVLDEGGGEGAVGVTLRLHVLQHLWNTWVCVVVVGIEREKELQWRRDRENRGKTPQYANDIGTVEEKL